MLRLAFRAALVVLLVLIVAVVGAVVVVLKGPTEFAFIRDRIAATLEQNLGPAYSVAIEKAVVDVDPVLGLVVRVDNIDISDSRHALVAHVPQTRFAVDPWSLLRLRVDVQRGRIVRRGCVVRAPLRRGVPAWRRRYHCGVPGATRNDQWRLP